MRYRSEKKLFNRCIILIVLFLSILTNAMDAPIDKGIVIKNFYSGLAAPYFLPRLDLQSIGRFATTCKVARGFSFEIICGEIPPQSICFNDLLGDDYYDKCTEILGSLFKKKNKVIFECIWMCHARKRELEIRNMYPNALNGFSSEAYMKMYYDSFKEIKKKKKRDAEELLKSKERGRANLKRRLRFSERYASSRGCLELLEREQIDIADLFPKKNDETLVSYLCNNIYQSDDGMKTFVSLTHKYMNKYSDQIVDCLLQRRKFYSMVYLIENNIIGVDARSKSGKTTLHYLNYGCGCYSSHWAGYDRCIDPVKDVQKLIDKGADINAIDNKGMTPLHYACKNAHAKTVSVLLKCNTIDSAKKNNKGKQPKDYINHLAGTCSDIKQDKKIIRLLLSSSMAQ